MLDDEYCIALAESVLGIEPGMRVGKYFIVIDLIDILVYAGFQFQG